jgi:hypothetical protein
MDAATDTFANNWHFDLVDMKLLSLRLGILQKLDKVTFERIANKFATYRASRKASVSNRVTEDRKVERYLDGEKMTKWTLEIVNKEKSPDFNATDRVEDILDKLKVTAYVPDSVYEGDVELYARTNNTITMYEAVTRDKDKLVKASFDLVHSLTDVIDSDFCGYYQRPSLFVASDVTHGIAEAAHAGLVASTAETANNGAVIQVLVGLTKDEKTEMAKREEDARRVISFQNVNNQFSSDDINNLVNVIFISPDFMNVVRSSLDLSLAASKFYDQFKMSLDSSNQ